MSSKSYSIPDEEPVDKYNIVFLIIVCIGMAVLLPFNALITAIDYFGSCDKYGPSFNFIITFAFNLPIVLIQLALMKWGDKFTFDLKLISSLTVYVIGLIFCPFISAIPGISNTVSYILIIIATMIMGGFCAIIFGSAAGLGAILGPNYSAGVMSGIGLGGIVIGILRILTKAVIPTSVENATLISCIVYFCVAAVATWMCIPLVQILHRLEFSRFHYSVYYNRQAEMRKNEESIPLKNGFDHYDEDTRENFDYVPITKEIDDDDDDDEIKNGETILATKVNYIEIWKKIWKDSFVVAFIFFNTLSLFPGLIFLIQPTMITENGWFPVIMIFLFQLFDFIGRTLPRWVTMPHQYIWMFALSRAIFFVLFIMCIYASWFDNDILSFILMAIFAFSNGFLSTCTMVFGPAKLRDDEKEAAGIILSFSIQTGVLAGSFFGIVLEIILNLIDGDGIISATCGDESSSG
eukprot:TRINITY_DN1101_c1_g1_i1.p1 TRINITY_DN1101_c1_g1~~TRINITY_DN1101_c1_g1_i1.p1  ORF type:complete len:464 (+),score=136.19 TRINITY_DN1101_c1_g1_i1:106-1497(+)